ncbi:ABC transporter substrate-binding protein [Candidatus Omnitrophota bacterium]
MKKVLIIFLCLFFVSSCCQRDSSKTLTITMSLGEEEWKVMRQDVFPPFEKEHNIKINAYQIESGQLATKLQALESAEKSEIDLFAQDNMNLAMLINKDLVLDLSQYQGRISGQIFENLTEACRFDSRLMFMPFRPNVQIAYYNKDAFTRYNLSPPRSWGELLYAAREFKQKEGRGRVLLKGFGGNPTATQLYEFILQAGGQPYSFDDPGCRLAFVFLKELWENVSEESKRAKWDTTNTILAQEEAYLAQNWPFGIVILVQEYGLDFIGTYSGWRGPAGEYHVIGGDVLGIPKACQNKELALQFIEYLQSKEVQEVLVAKLGWPSIRKDAYAQVQDWQKPHYESVKQALSHGRFRENVAWWPAYAKYVTEAFRECVIGQADVDATLKKYKEKLEKDKTLY